MPATYRQFQDTVTESLPSGAQVDREAGILRGVKLIGTRSKNNRVYPAKVLREGLRHYEGAKVNIDHPDRADTGRKYSDRFGVIRNAIYREGEGNFGDLHFNPKHTLAEQFIWDAKNNPESLGFSHNATVTGRRQRDGSDVIEEIKQVRSMDLVADPATTSSLFESEQPMDDEPAEQTDPKAAMKGAFRQMIVAAVDDESLDMKATMAKIKEIMKAQEKLMGGGSSAPEDPAESESEESVNQQQNNPEMDLLKQQLEQYQEKERQTKLVESIDSELAAAGLDPKNTQHVSELFSKTLQATESEDDRKALIADRAALVGAKRVTESSDPVYRPQTEGGTGKPLNYKNWVA